MNALSYIAGGLCCGSVVFFLALLTLGLCRAAAFGDQYDGVPKDE